MPLDLSSVIKQISEMVFRLKTGRKERLDKISRSIEVLHGQSENLERLQKKIAISKTTWLVAEPTEIVDRCFAPFAVPSEFSIIATDGSHIDVDRHHSTRCYLINISSVVLRYGAHPDAKLESSPKVYSSEDELIIASQDKLREVAVEGNLLGIKRSIEECGKLVEEASALPAGSTALALTDGSLLFWDLEAYPDFVSEIMLEKGYLAHLEELWKLGINRHLAMAGYISFPRSTDVVNALRVAICPKDTVDSDRCFACKSRECYSLAGVHDRELFAGLLEPGERSALFISPSRIQKRYGRHLVYFFYLRVDDEIARVEIPQWVAKDEIRLNLVHGLLLDQCKRGQGYPVALSEAHEKAVVTGADRENFWQMVEATLTEEHIPVSGSAKSQSKRMRGI